MIMRISNRYNPLPIVYAYVTTTVNIIRMIVFTMSIFIIVNLSFSGL